MTRSPKPILILLVLAAAALSAQAPAPGGPDVKISPALLARLDADGADPVKVWLYLRDKGEEGEAGIARDLAAARAAFAPRALSRRAKVRPEARLVEYEDLPVAPAYIEEIRARAGKIRAVSRWLNAVSVEADAESVRDLAGLECVRALDVVQGFRRGEPPIAASEDLSPSTAAPQAPIPPFPPSRTVYGPSLRQIDIINVRPLHAQGLTGRGVIVAILDTGFRKSHQAFRSSSVLAERDFVMGDGDVQQNPADPKDYSDLHGTACWSLLGGFAPGQIIGPAFGADFLLAKTEDGRSEKPVEEDYWVAGMEWAEALGADVLSSSLGYTDWYTYANMDGRTAVTTKAADRAVSLGVVVVTAVGNERQNSWGHVIAPADAFDVIAVGAVDARRALASFSSPGPTYDGRIKPEVCAMGANNYIATNSSDTKFSWGSGTSFSTPMTAGAAALLLEARPDWTPAQVRAALMQTAGNAASPNNDTGWGIINAAAAARAGR